MWQGVEDCIKVPDVSVPLGRHGYVFSKQVVTYLPFLAERGGISYNRLYVRYLSHMIIREMPFRSLVTVAFKDAWTWMKLGRLEVEGNVPYCKCKGI